MTKIFKVPFADTGDKISPPDAVQPDGSVSYTLGYGFDYQRDTSLDGGVPVDPLAKVFPREQHNGILNDITTAIGEIQANGLTIWQAAGGPYPINALVRYSGTNWRSTVANNATTPGAVGASWIDPSYQPNATETIVGIIRIATQTETDAGTNDSAAITPKKLAEKVKQATETSLGIARIAIQSDLTAEANDEKIVTPKKLGVWFKTKVATYTDAGIAAFATAADVISGASTTKTVSPATIAFGFQVLKSPTGYIKFPNWLGGLIVQWTKTPVLNISVPYVWTYPIQFPNMVSGTFGMFIGFSQGTLEVTENPTLTNSKFANGLAGSAAGPAFVFAWGF